MKGGQAKGIRSFLLPQGGLQLGDEEELNSILQRRNALREHRFRRRIEDTEQNGDCTAERSSGDGG